MSISISKLLLLSDQAEIAVEERNRIRALGLTSSSNEDSDLVKNLRTLQKGIYDLQVHNARENDDPNRQKTASRLIESYNRIVESFGQDESVDTQSLQYVSPDIENENEELTQSRRMNKSVRFKDDLVEESPLKVKKQQEQGRQEQERQELFMEPYRDEPEATDTDGLSSSQLHTQQQQVMRDQDQRLDRLGTSVSRQHELSIQIDDELSSHLQLLDEVDTLVDSSHSRLEAAKRRLAKFSRKARENGSLVTIIILILIFIILIVVLK